MLLVTALAGCARSSDGSSAPAHGDASAARSPAASTATAGVPPLAHVVVIIEENKPTQAILGNPDATYLNQLANSGAVATNYSAITHPSLPNYLALTSGTTAGITSDCNPPGGRCVDRAPNIAQALERAGKSWKMYAESMPSPCSTANTSRYAVKHNPFLYFPSVTSDQAACHRHDVPLTQLTHDLAAASTTPSLAVISPNLCNDMHDCSIARGDAWLRRTVPAILASPAFRSQRSLLAITFDEGNDLNNSVACVFAGPVARSGARDSTAYNHYSLLRTIEEGLGVPPLGTNDRHASSMASMLR
ncbi:alkaline phosphatase family protein [Curtobacterium ammoniigenes]|uniref:alkaline phosphatase family protein n=1 Tax=Curtobacterium ammoniigenes TaxID=395387 RepID=UPI001470805A|nr:alkaline phosphatase family protein [Curtobacterium ammoniigenes]